MGSKMQMDSHPWFLHLQYPPPSRKSIPTCAHLIPQLLRKQSVWSVWKNAIRVKFLVLFYNWTWISYWTLQKKNGPVFMIWYIYIYSTTKNIGAFVPILSHFHIFLCLPPILLGETLSHLTPTTLSNPRGWRRRMDCQGHQVWLGILG